MKDDHNTTHWFGACPACPNYFYSLLLPEAYQRTNYFTTQNAVTDGLVAALLVLADGSCTSATCTTHDSTATRTLHTLSQVHKYIHGNTHFSKTHSIRSNELHIKSAVRVCICSFCFICFLLYTVKTKQTRQPNKDITITGSHSSDLIKSSLGYHTLLAMAQCVCRTKQRTVSLKECMQNSQYQAVIHYRSLN